MSIHGECFDNGSSERCTIYDCEKFSRAECPRPEEIIGYEEEEIDHDMWQDMYKAYPQLIPNKPEERKTMNKFEKRVTVQKNDRVKASNKLMTTIDRLTKIKPESPDQPFFTDDTKEIYNKGISIPVVVTCLETDGERRVYFNAIEAGGTVISVLASGPLLDCLKDMQMQISKEDAAIGCEDLNRKASELL